MDNFSLVISRTVPYLSIKQSKYMAQISSSFPPSLIEEVKKHQKETGIDTFSRTVLTLVMDALIAKRKSAERKSKTIKSK